MTLGKFAFSLLLVASLNWANAAAQAAQIYTQMPPASVVSGGVRSHVLHRHDGHDQDVRGYDDFVLSSPSTVSQLTWMGSPADSKTHGFIITLYAAQTAPAKGPDLFRPLFTQFISGLPDHRPMNGDWFEFTTPLKKPIQLAAHTPYWISIVASRRDLSPWYWAHGLGGDGKSLQFFNEYRVLPAAGDRAFSFADSPR